MGAAPELGFGLVAFETSIRHPRKMLSKHKSGGQQGGLDGRPLEPEMHRWNFSHLPRVSVVADAPPRKHSPGFWQGLSEGLLARQMSPISVVLHQNHPVGTTKTTHIITTRGRGAFPNSLPPFLSQLHNRKRLLQPPSPPRSRASGS